MVAEVRLPASTAGDEQSLVQDSWSRKPFRKVRCVTTVGETAVYGPVRTVVWEDGDVLCQVPIRLTGVRPYQHAQVLLT